MPSADRRGQVAQAQGGLNVIAQVVGLDQEDFHQSVNRYRIRAATAPIPCFQEIFFPSS